MKRRFFRVITICLLCLLLCGSIVLSVLLAHQRSKTEAQEEKWESATNHQLYEDDGLRQNANVYMKDAVCSGSGISFTVVNDTRYTLYTSPSHISMQRYENGAWHATEFGCMSREVLMSIPPREEVSMSTSLYIESVDVKGQISIEPNTFVPKGLYRVLLDMTDYYIVGYISY